MWRSSKRVSCARAVGLLGVSSPMPWNLGLLVSNPVKGSKVLVFRPVFSMRLGQAPRTSARHTVKSLSKLW